MLFRRNRIASTFAVIAVLTLSSVCHAQSTELRAMWVVRYSLKSPAAIRNIVRTAKSHGFNALFVQARGRGDAWYNSDIEPRAEALADQPADFDPLAVAIQEAHAQGIQVHAWLNTFLTWSGSHAPKSPKHVVNAHPDWVARDRDGKFTMRGTDSVEGMFLQPSNPEVQQHIYRVFTDVADRYNIDGIHFDYVRYPNVQYDYSPATLARFKQYMEPKMSDQGRAAVKADGSPFAYVHTFPTEWAEWRRAQVTNLVQRIADTVHKTKPRVVVSAAVFPNADDAFTERGQDWRGWLAAGYLDAVCPMAYSGSNDKVEQQVQRAVQAAGGKPVYAGIGAWRINAESTAQKIARARRAGAKGINLFSYDGVTEDGKSTSYLDYIQAHCFGDQPAVTSNTPTVGEAR